MYSKIPGNVELRINLSGDVVDTLGNDIKLPIDDKGRYQVEIFGKTETLDPKTLSLIARFQIEHLLMLGVPVSNFEFYTVKTKLLTMVADTIMMFKEPVYYKDGYRFIPNYHRFAISREGVVIDTFTPDREFRVV